MNNTSKTDMRHTFFLPISKRSSGTQIQLRLVFDLFFLLRSQSSLANQVTPNASG